METSAKKNSVLSQNNEKGPIFIVGAARSSTTLLQYMLKSHPAIAIPTGESHFFVPIYQNKEKFGNLRDLNNVKAMVRAMYEINPQFFNEELHGFSFDIDTVSTEIHAAGRTTVTEAINHIMTQNAAGLGKKRWAEKTPYYILHLPLILQMFPNAKIIHIIRDGRDCALSMLERSKDLQIFNLYHAAYLWKRYVDHGQHFAEQLGDDQYFELRYEDLLNSPQISMQSLCNFIGEEYSDKIVNFVTSTDPNAKTPLLRQPLQKNNTEKWRKTMTGWQLQVFESMAADTLKKNGYELAARKHKINTRARLGYEEHIKLMSWKYRPKNDRHQQVIQMLDNN